MGKKTSLPKTATSFTHGKSGKDLPPIRAPRVRRASSLVAEKLSGLMLSAPQKTVTHTLRRPHTNMLWGMALNQHNRITGVQPNSPAMAAGLQPYDLVVRVNGEDPRESRGNIAESREQLSEMIPAHWRWLTLVVMRPPKSMYRAIDETEVGDDPSELAAPPGGLAEESSLRLSLGSVALPGEPPAPEGLKMVETAEADAAEGSAKPLEGLSLDEQLRLKKRRVRITSEPEVEELQRMVSSPLHSRMGRKAPIKAGPQNKSTPKISNPAVMEDLARKQKAARAISGRMGSEHSGDPQLGEASTDADAQADTTEVWLDRMSKKNQVMSMIL